MTYNTNKFARVLVNVDTDEPNPRIRNCKFSFRCTQRWEILKATTDKTIRYCSECNRDVHFCKTDSELCYAILKNLCVAIVDIEAEDAAYDVSAVVGLPVNPEGDNRTLREILDDMHKKEE